MNTDTEGRTHFLPRFALGHWPLSECSPRSNRPYGDALRRQELLYVPYGELPEMKDAGGQHGVRFAFEQHLGHVFELARAAAGDHRHADALADAPRDDEVKPLLRAIRVNAIEHDLAGAERHGALGPLDRFPAGRLAAAMREDLPPVRRHFAGVDGHHDALAAELLGPGANQVRVGDRR